MIWWGYEHGVAAHGSHVSSGKAAVQLTGSDAAVDREQFSCRPVGAVRADLSEGDLAKIVAKTDGYSGSDMAHLVREVSAGLGDQCRWQVSGRAGH